MEMDVFLHSGPIGESGKGRGGPSTGNFEN
jgi:hypothetical protein